MALVFVAACSASLVTALTPTATEPAVEPAPPAPPQATPVGTRFPEAVREVPRVPLGRAPVGRPNLLVVTTDDMRWDELRYMPWTQRWFARRGVRFANSFSPFPLCCPARASFLTGQDTQNHGVFTSLADYGFGAFDDSRTLATALRAGGYRTGLVGRYLNGYGRQPSLVTGGNSARYVPAGWADWAVAPELDVPLGMRISGGPFRYFDTTLNVGGQLVPHPGEYNTELFGRTARALLASYADLRRPWFTWLPVVAPHQGQPVCEPDDPCGIRTDDGRRVTYPTPARPEWVKGWYDDVIPRAPGLRPDGSSEARVSDQPEWTRLPRLNEAERLGVRELARQRAESLLVLDRELRSTVRLLRSTGQLARTVIVFTSDNGLMLGEHRFPKSKSKAWEPALRVPLLVSGPGVPRGVVRYDPATVVDLTATLADYAGVSFPYPIDGASLRPTIEGGDRGWRVPVRYAGLVPGLGPADPARRAWFTDARDAIGLRTARWTYVLFRSGKAMLYDLDRDPNQLVNLAGRRGYRVVEARLRTVTLAYRDCWGASCQRPLPAWLQRGPSELAVSTRSQAARLFTLR